MPAPMIRTKMPKLFFSFSASNFLATNPPMNIPAIAIEEIVPRNFQLMVKWPRSPANPTSEFKAMINSDVPTAFFISRPSNKTKVGIIRNPPPAPSKPVVRPMTIP